MKIDTGMRMTTDVAALMDDVRAREAEGYDGIWSSETAHEPFLPLAVVAANSERMEMGTSIAIAFARNPMTLANVGWDLQAMSKGRFIMGLGSQIKPHITKRFSMEWSRPAARMREMIQAMHAIWDTWRNGSPLEFRGEFYRHTLMTPYFVPDPDDLGDFGPPRIHLAGVGELMTKVAGEVADGFFCHGFSTEKYLREVTLPALAAARAGVGKSMDDFEIHGPMFVATGRDDEHLEASIGAMRETIAFYGSTPAYRGVLEIHGWGDLQTDLNTLSKRGQWEEMGTLVDDDVLHAFAIVGRPDDIAPEIGRRYGDVVDRLSFTPPRDLDPEVRASMMTDLREVTA